MKILSKKGFRVARQKRESYNHEGPNGEFTVVPRKNEIKRGTLLSIIEESGLTKDQFLDLL